ncbi:MAG: alcohol dehydrogenase catalytic domain-containing protein [Candidatus Korobacteraceae bacterium]|jgi:L-iditol 2-dehydrogenase
MKALIYTGPTMLEYREEPDPIPAVGEVLVHVEAVGICGSDMHAYHGRDERRPAPLVLGHEAAGRIVSGPRAGRRVTINPLVTCGVCGFCIDGRSHLCRSRQMTSMPPRSGAFAELVRIPATNLVELPDGLPMQQAALAEPMAAGWHAVRNASRALSRPLAAARCVVLGAGAVGLACALALRHFGAKEILLAETNELRRKALASFRSFAPGDSSEPPEWTVDLVLDAVGSNTTRTAASRMIKPGGVIVHIGLLSSGDGLDIRKITLQEVTFLGSYCYTHLDFIETVDAMAAGHLGNLDWMEERPLSEGRQAFRELDEGKVAAAKVILRP